MQLEGQTYHSGRPAGDRRAGCPAGHRICEAQLAEAAGASSAGRGPGGSLGPWLGLGCASVTRWTGSWVSPRRVWRTITVPQSRDGAERDARHPMAAQCLAVGVL